MFQFFLLILSVVFSGYFLPFYNGVCVSPCVPTKADTEINVLVFKVLLDSCCFTYFPMILVFETLLCECSPIHSDCILGGVNHDVDKLLQD